MWETIVDPGAALAEAALLGVLLSMTYDLLRVRRALLPLPAAFVFVEDILYSLFSAFAFFLTLLDVADGSPRWWLLLATAAGWFAAHFTIGLVAVTLARFALFLVRSVVWWALHFALLPLLRRVRQKNIGKKQNPALAKRAK